MLLSHGGSSRGISCLLFTRMVLVPNYRIIELVYFHTEHHGESRDLCHELSNYRISFSHGMSRMVTVFSHEFSSCPELSNLRIGLFSHGASRMVTVLLSRDLSFGPTDQREVICELSNFSSHGESRRVSGFMSRIIEFLFTRRVTEVFFVTRHVLGHEFANCRVSFFTRMVVEVMRVEL